MLLTRDLKLVPLYVRSPTDKLLPSEENGKLMGSASVVYKVTLHRGIYVYIFVFHNNLGTFPGSKLLLTSVAQ